MATAQTQSVQASTHRQFHGVVVRVSSAKTIAVSTKMVTMHAKYRKQYTRTKTYLVHDESQRAKPGDAIVFEECRPMSKTKRWRLVHVEKVS